MFPAVCYSIAVAVGVTTLLLLIYVSYVNYFELRRTRVELQRLADFELLVQMSLDMQCIVSFQGYFIFNNSAFEHVLQYTAEDYKRNPFIGYVDPDDREATNQAMSALLRGEDVIDFENRYIRKDGEIVNMSWNAHADVHRNVICAVARDVTSNRLLRALEQARLSAEAEAKAKSQFLVCVSRE
jgi:PAS domain S-box-containing protein